MSQPELYAALAAAQGEFPVILKDKEVVVRTKADRTYTFKYAPLETIIAAVRPALARHGLSITQTVIDGHLVSRLTHSSGSALESQTAIMFERGTAQEYGSALTYARRYSLTLLLNLAADDDDDANLAAGNEVTVTRPADKTSEFDSWLSAIEMADADALKDIGKELSRSTMPDSEKAKLRAAYAIRQHSLANAA